MNLERPLSTLVQPKWQRLQIWLSVMVSILMLIPLQLQLQSEADRTVVPQLDSANLKHCELAGCVMQDLGNLEVASFRIVEQKWATFVEVEFRNPGRLLGEREFWLELINPEGQIAEAAKTRLQLQPKGVLTAIFSFQRTPEILNQGTLRLSY